MNLILADSFIKLNSKIIGLSYRECQITFSGEHYIVDIMETNHTTIIKVPKTQIFYPKPHWKIEELEDNKVYLFVFNADTEDVFILWLTFEQFGEEQTLKYIS